MTIIGIAVFVLSAFASGFVLFVVGLFVMLIALRRGASIQALFGRFRR